MRLFIKIDACSLVVGVTVFCSAPASSTPGRSECGVPTGAGNGAGGLSSDHPSRDKVELWAHQRPYSGPLSPGCPASVDQAALGRRLPWSLVLLLGQMKATPAAQALVEGMEGAPSPAPPSPPASFSSTPLSPADPSHRLSSFLQAVSLPQRQTSQSPHGSVATVRRAPHLPTPPPGQPLLTVHVST